MALQDLANISQILQAVLVVVSLGFIWYQLRESVRLAKAENARALIGYANHFDSMLIHNSELADLWYSYGRGLEKQGKTAQRRYRKLLVQRLAFHEYIYYQAKNKLLDEDMYNAWIGDLKRVARCHNLDMVAGAGRLHEVFPGDFGDHLEKLQSKAQLTRHNNMP